MSLYSHKKAGNGGVQPWSQVINLFPGGGDVSALFSFYKSLGDAVLTGGNFVPTVLDGPEKVVRYGALTVGDGTLASSLTASQRCKGLVILCDSLLVRNNATINMTGKGPRVDRNDDEFFPFVDCLIPNKITLSSNVLSYTAALALIASCGFAPWDFGTWQSWAAPMFGVNLAVAVPGTVVMIQATGAGAGGACGYTANGSAPGGTGGAGVNGSFGGGGGGGAHGDSYGAYGASGRNATPYCGGAGGGVGSAVGGGYTNPFNNFKSGPYGGHYDPSLLMTCIPNPGGSNNGIPFGGAAGIPAGPGINGGPAGGLGVGGKLTVICRGTVTVQPGGKIEANGMPSATYIYTGGGSGGGHVAVISPAAPANSGTIQAAGGVSGGTYGGYGGAGSVVTKTFTQMGW